MFHKVFLDDLSIVTGGKFISRESGIAFSDFKLEHFGKFSKLESNCNGPNVGDPGPNCSKLSNELPGVKDLEINVLNSNEEEEDDDDLEIPAFLRRQKN